MKPTPLALIAELTHRCPLHCVYCSNPLELQARSRELDTEIWKRVFEEAANLGVLQLHLTGGEPTARADITELIAHGRATKLYTNLITSGVGLTEERVRTLCKAGLDHVQLSLQDSQESFANEFAGTKAHALKLKMAGIFKKFPLALTINIVVHRRNLARLEEMVALAESLGADRIEIANAQYYGWAFKNRAALMPTREQIKSAMQTIRATQERLKGRIRVDFAAPDYFAKYPKPCMNGWGQKSLLIDPAGRALPCHSAMVIPGMDFENVKDKPLAWIWEESEAFRRFRGEDWMEEPCRSCDRRAQDFGGCRCQAFLVTGNANAADPVCSLSPSRSVVDQAIAAADGPDGASTGSWHYRDFSKNEQS